MTIKSCWLYQSARSEAVLYGWARNPTIWAPKFSYFQEFKTLKIYFLQKWNLGEKRIGCSGKKTLQNVSFSGNRCSNQFLFVLGCRKPKIRYWMHFLFEWPFTSASWQAYQRHFKPNFFFLFKYYFNGRGGNDWSSWDLPPRGREDRVRNLELLAHRHWGEQSVFPRHVLLLGHILDICSNWHLCKMPSFGSEAEKSSLVLLHLSPDIG